MGEVDHFYLGFISIVRGVIPSHKIVMNLPSLYEKLSCKGELYRFSAERDPSVQTYILLLNYKDAV